VIQALTIAYGAFAPAALSRCGSALALAARALDAGDLARASVAALHMR
jgi:hypothetical protein